MENNHYLIGSSFLLGIPLLGFLLKENKNNIEYLLSFLLFVNIICSCLFWYCPEIGSTMHQLDGYFGRLSLLIFSIYTISLKSRYWLTTVGFIFFLLGSLILFSYSSYYSSKEWCCDNHIICHIWFHLFISAGCLFAFI
jgi:hypothetical protein